MDLSIDQKFDTAWANRVTLNRLLNSQYSANDDDLAFALSLAKRKGWIAPKTLKRTLRNTAKSSSNQRAVVSIFFIWCIPPIVLALFVRRMDIWTPLVVFWTILLATGVGGVSAQRSRSDKPQRDRSQTKTYARFSLKDIDHRLHDLFETRLNTLTVQHDQSLDAQDLDERSANTQGSSVSVPSF